MGIGYIILAAILAYLLGSIPTAILVSKGHFGIDIRDYGSGNAGATNTFRVLGKKYGILVMVVDVLKGFTAANFPFLLGNFQYGTIILINLQLLFGLLAVIGHVFPVYVGFKGGKGVATLFGMILAIHFPAAMVCAGIFLLTLLATRYVSLSSILAAVALPVGFIFVFRNQEPLLIGFGIVTALMVVLTHKKNIQRLVQGEESKANLIKRRQPKK